MVQQSSSRINSLQHRLTAGQIESFRLASEFQSRLQMLNNTVLRITARRGSGGARGVSPRGGGLNEWIDQHDPKLNPRSPLYHRSGKAHPARVEQRL